MNPIINKKKVVPYLSKVYCPDCNLELEESPVVLTSYPPQFQYFCPQCGYGYTTTEKYPKIDFEEEVEDVQQA